MKAGYKRISSEERRESIIRAARHLFARRGFDGATISAICEQAGISEALLYHHFESKDQLHQIVLADMAANQDRMYEAIGLPEPSAESLVSVILLYLQSCIATEPCHLPEGLRVLLASLSGDGGYASAVYARTVALQIGPVSRAMEAAQLDGSLAGRTLAPVNASMFIEHVGTQLAASVALPASPYHHDKARLLAEAVRYCCRGLGLTENVIENRIADLAATISKREALVA